MSAAIQDGTWSAERCARLLNKPKQSPTGWKACCPAHEDKDPSLFLADGDDGLALICYAGCNYQRIVQALEAKGAVLSHRQDRSRIPEEHFQLGQYHASWDYRDSTGRILMRVCRWEQPGGKKDIRPLVRTADGWKWAHHPNPRPLYQLDRLANEPDVPVLLVEGEKTAAAAQKLFPAHIATTWPGGAAAMGQADDTPLVDRDVILIPDCDAPGRKAMGWWLKRLAGRTRSVRIVDPGKKISDLPKGWDLADALVEQRDVSGWLDFIATDDPKGTTVCAAKDAVTVDDFRAYMPSHEYIFIPSREMWPAASVNARVAPVDMGSDEPMKPSAWLDRNRAIEQMTWAPGLPMLIENQLVSNGGWIDHPGCACFNLYRPPGRIDGDPAQADPWLNHIHKVYPDNALHIVHWMAHRVQHPGVKINHALVFGGNQGIGKDTLIEPVKYAVGPWNFAEVSPSHLLGRFNGFVKSVILRISEARDLGDVDRFSFYDHMKIYTAAPPDVLRCDEKHIREHAVMNVCGVIVTSNHKTDGIYLPADDRRHYVAWSTLAKEDFTEAYWRDLYHWYGDGGYGHVAAYLAEVDLLQFDAKAPPPKTPAFWDIVDANRSPEDAELADVLDTLNNPRAVTLADLTVYAGDDFRDWLQDRRNRRQIPHRLESAGYVPVRNDAATDGLWKVGQKRQAIYALATQSIRDRIIAAAQLCKGGSR